MRVPPPDPDAAGKARPLDALAATALAAMPDLRIRTVSLQNGKVVFEGQTGHWLVRDRAAQAHVDARTGEVLHIHDAGDLSPYWRWTGTADPLHFGDFGGLASKLVWFAFGLCLCAIVLTGFRLHLARLAREARGPSRSRWAAAGPATSATLALLAVVVWFGFVEARELWGAPGVDGDRRLPALGVEVAAFIALWSCVTLLIALGWMVALDRATGAPPLRDRPLARLLPRGWL